MIRTGCPGSAIVSVTDDGAFFSNHVPCDGSHPHAGVAVAPTPDSAELQEMLARQVRDGAKLAVIHRELERKSGRPLSYKLPQSRVLRETLNSAVVGDDNAAFVMAVPAMTGSPCPSGPLIASRWTGCTLADQRQPGRPRGHAPVATQLRRSPDKGSRLRRPLSEAPC